MFIAVLFWQALIFISIALAGRRRGGVIAFWVVWTLFQVFALWLSVIQFGTILLAASLFGAKSAPRGDAGLPGPPQRRIAPEQAAAFKQALAQWSAEVKLALSSRGWIPGSALAPLAAAFPAPDPQGHAWKALTGDESPQATLQQLAGAANHAHLARQRIECKPFFDSVESHPLTDEQIQACICMDDAVMVVAAAGSGKTSTLVAKTGYVLRQQLATPGQVLLLAFNRATADELGERIAARLGDVPAVDQVRSSTFHAFGIEVIGAATGKRPALAPWLDPANPGADVREVGRIIEALCRQDPRFRRDWDLLRTVYGRDVGKFGQRQEPDAYAGGRRGFLTAKGDVVKSREERVIADWLFYSGVAYAYEAAYEHETANATHRQYFPDFHYPDAKLYHEHFALDARGQPPKDFKDYLAGVAWKRQLHARMGTALVETTSHSLKTGDWLETLEAALVARGVRPVFDPDRQAPGLPPVPQEELARSFRVFQQHAKNNRLDHAQLLQALAAQSEDGFGARLRLYLSLYERIAAEWERRLQAGGLIDFEDMLVQAAGHVESGAYASPYTVILADEFQDSSRARVRLLKALAANPGVRTHLCVVGDDWQGINRFAGADIAVMTGFAQVFEHATRLTLGTTFRCPREICEVSSRFIQQNPAQIRKQVGTTNPLAKQPLRVFGFQAREAMALHVEQALADMHRYVGQGKLKPMSGSRVTVMLLGRYRDDLPASLRTWQQRFGDRLQVEFRTVHGAKGLEAEYVFVLNVVQGTRGFPSQIQDDPALQLAMPAPDPFPYAEERRLFYVALTRARRQARVYTLLAQPSQFVVELAKAGLVRIEAVDGEALEACPQCGSGVVQARSGAYGEFRGCSRFPACDYTEKVAREGAAPSKATGRSQRIEVPVEAGDACPVCRRGVIEQKNGANGPFLGCTRFREGCRATASLRRRGG